MIPSRERLEEMLAYKGAFPKGVCIKCGCEGPLIRGSRETACWSKECSGRMFSAEDLLSHLNERLTREREVFLLKKQELKHKTLSELQGVAKVVGLEGGPASRLIPAIRRKQRNARTQDRPNSNASANSNQGKRPGHLHLVQNRNTSSLGAQPRPNLLHASLSRQARQTISEQQKERYGIPWERDQDAQGVRNPLREFLKEFKRLATGHPIGNPFPAPQFSARGLAANLAVRDYNSEQLHAYWRCLEA